MITEKDGIRYGSLSDVIMYWVINFPIAMMVIALNCWLAMWLENWI